jgi:hypothetical protein
MSRIPLCPDNRLTASWLSVLSEGRVLPKERSSRVSKPQGHGATAKLKRQLNDLIGTPTRDLQACSIKSQPYKLRRAWRSTYGLLVSDYAWDWSRYWIYRVLTDDNDK